MANNDPIFFLNGNYVREDEAKVSVFDRCFLYGDGLFEGVAVWESHPFRLDAHLDRMGAGLRYLRIEPDLSHQDWWEIVRQVIRRNEMSDGYLRIQVSRGEGISSIRWEPRLLRNPKPNVVVIPVPGLASYYAGMGSQSSEDEGLSAIVVSRPRISSRSIPSGIKHCNYLDSVLGAMDVSDCGADIGLAIDEQGFLTEGVAYNIFAVQGGKLVTPPVQRDLLPGITRQVILDLHRAAGGEAEERDIDLFALCSADEVFVCSTLKFAEPVTMIGGRVIGDGRRGPVTRKLHDMLIKEMSEEARNGGKETRENG